MNVVVFDSTGISYDSVRFFSRQIKEAFDEVGCRTFLLDYIPTPESVRGKIDLIIGFNLDPSIKDENDEYIFDRMEIPIVDIILDHPLMHYRAMECDLSNLYVVCLDRYHEEFIRRYYPHIKGVTTGYMTGKSSDAVGKMIRDRSIELLLCGSYSDDSVYLREVDETWDEYHRELFYKSLEYMDRNPLCPTEKAVMQAIEGVDRQSVPGDTKIYAELRKLWTQLDIYYRKRNRRVVLEGLIKAEIGVTLYGKGWEELPFADSPLLEIHPPVSFAESFDRIADAKINLNIMPMFKHGFHDRIFSTIMNGAVVATDESELIRERFHDGEDSLIFSLDRIDELAFRLKEILVDMERLQTMADAGTARMNEFTILETVESILTMVFYNDKSVTV